MKANDSKLKLIILSILVGLVLLSAAFLIYQSFAPKQEGVTAVVAVGGKDLLAIDLSKAADPYEIDLDELIGVPVVLEVIEHQVHFKSSECPDQICVHTGWLWRDMDIAVCMPNQVSVIVMPTGDVKK